MTAPLLRVSLAPRAEKDLRRMERAVVRRVRDALEALGADAANLDVKPLAGHAPWRRLRAGDIRIVFREVEDGTSVTRYLVARIVDRRDLARTVNRL